MFDVMAGKSLAEEKPNLGRCFAGGEVSCRVRRPTALSLSVARPPCTEKVGPQSHSLRQDFVAVQLGSSSNPH
jgi:hypothetical protein